MAGGAARRYDPAVTTPSALRVVCIVLLIVLVLLLGLPLGVGMGGMRPCAECSAPGASYGFAMCLAVLTLFALVVGALASAAGRVTDRARRLDLARPIERPPRLG